MASKASVQKALMGHPLSEAGHTDPIHPAGALQSSTVAVDGVLDFVAAVAVRIHDVSSEGRVVGVDIAIPVIRHDRAQFLGVGLDIDGLIGRERDLVGAARRQLSVQEKRIAIGRDEMKLGRDEAGHQQSPQGTWAVMDWIGGAPASDDTGLLACTASEASPSAGRQRTARRQGLWFGNIELRDGPAWPCRSDP